MAETVTMDVPCWNGVVILNQDYYEGNYKVNPLVNHIGFATRTDMLFPVMEKEDAYIRYGESTQTPPGQNQFLWDHPIASRSFAIFPLIKDNASESSRTIQFIY